MRRMVFALAVGGVLFCLVGLSMLTIPAARAQSLPERPTLTPIPQPREEDDKSTPAPSGRITGTVIDATTGAPAPGIPVQVGDVTVTTDANGNYDRSGLPAGSYTVMLALPAERGQSEQGPVTIALSAGATVVQHLRFRSPIASIAEPTPIALPETGGADPRIWLLALGSGMLLAAGALRRYA